MSKKILKIALKSGIINKKLLGGGLMKTVCDGQVYIVLSQSGSLVSRFLKFITKDDFNHVSIALNEQPQVMYSFGRRFCYYPFWSGFVVESSNFGTFKRFQNTRAVVLSLDVNEDNYLKIKSQISSMLKKQYRFHYNYLGVLFSPFKINVHTKHSFYCSQFVKDILEKNGVLQENTLPTVSKPVDFLEIDGVTKIFDGKLKDFSLNIAN